MIAVGRDELMVLETAMFVKSEFDLLRKFTFDTRRSGKARGRTGVKNSPVLC